MEKGPLTDEYLIYGEGLGKPAEQEVPEAERLLKEFESHDGKEGDFIRSYKEIATKSKDPLIKFLLQLIIADEERHHAVMHAMASSLRGSINWSKPQDAIPTLGELGAEKDELTKLTGDFIKLEKDGIKESKQLLKATKGYYQGLFTLLVTTMIHDSEKHVEILDFLRQRLKKA
jgi:rubrerythrin